MSIKQLSLDVWNTLITPNPLFTDARMNIIGAATGIDKVIIKKSHTNVKRMLDDMAEISGCGFSTAYVWDLFFKSVGYDSDDKSEIVRMVTNEFLRLPPIIHPNVIDALQYARERGIELTIASNTNYIPGSTMIEFFRRHSLKFEYCVFSDEECLAKPHPEFFNKVIPLSKFDRIEICHIGDNQICDIIGADRVGIRACKLNSPEELLSKIVNVLS